MSKQKIGSITAKGGFLNESNICDKFMNYKQDHEAKTWLSIMGYDLRKIRSVLATQIPVRISLEKAISLGVLREKYDQSIKFKKADIQIRVEIIIDDLVYIENLSLKKSNKSAGFNQVDKRPVLTYQQLWKFNDNIASWLRLFTGDILPQHVLTKKELGNIKDPRRLFFNEIPTKDVKEIVQFFEENKSLVIFDVLRGRGGLSAEWLLVTRNNNGIIDWVLKDINSVCNFFSQGDVKLTPRGSLKIGRVTMQRKGGTPDPTSLQFKINPLDLFEEYTSA